MNFFDPNVSVTAGKNNAVPSQTDLNKASRENALKSINRSIFKYVDDNYGGGPNPVFLGFARAIPFVGGLIPEHQSKGIGDGLISADNVKDFGNTANIDLNPIVDSINKANGYINPSGDHKTWIANGSVNEQIVGSEHIREFISNFSSNSNDAFLYADRNNDKLLTKEELDQFWGARLSLNPEKSNSANKV